MRRAKHELEALGDQLGLSFKTSKLADAAEHLEQEPASINDASYQHAILCQVGLPRRRLQETSFERRNGNASLLLTAGKMYNGREWVQQPLPYGPKARLILINLTSYAVRHKTPIVDVGRSTREFMLRVGLDDQGSEYKSLRNQTRSLAVCRMQLAGRSGDLVRQIDAQPIRRFDAWINPNIDQPALWPGTIELTAEYYESCLELATPLDERAVAALRGSALSLDIYTWLAHRLWRVKDQKGSLVNWPALFDQFGQEYRHMADFKKKFLISLKQALSVYPEARVDQRTDGLQLRTSAPPIPKAKAYLVR